MTVSGGAPAAGGIADVRKAWVDLFCGLRNLHNSGINVIYFNALSLNGLSMDEVRNIFENSSADIICISETWFNPGLPEWKYAINKVKLYRNDRKVKRGGGVAIYCRTDFNAKLVSVSYDDGIEFISVEISDNNFKALISCVYRSPSCQCSCDPLFSDLASRLVEHEYYLVCGDFNINLISNDLAVKTLNDYMCNAGLYLVNSSVPSFANLLDYILGSDIAAIMKFDQTSFISDHDFLYCCVNIKLLRVLIAILTILYMMHYSLIFQTLFGMFAGLAYLSMTN